MRAGSVRLLRRIHNRRRQRGGPRPSPRLDTGLRANFRAPPQRQSMRRARCGLAANASRLKSVTRDPPRRLRHQSIKPDQLTAGYKTTALPDNDIGEEAVKVINAIIVASAALLGAVNNAATHSLDDQGSGGQITWSPQRLAYMPIDRVAAAVLRPTMPGDVYAPQFVVVLPNRWRSGKAFASAFTAGALQCAR